MTQPSKDGGASTAESRLSLQPLVEAHPDVRWHCLVPAKPQQPDLLQENLGIDHEGCQKKQTTPAGLSSTSHSGTSSMIPSSHVLNCTMVPRLGHGVSCQLLPKGHQSAMSHLVVEKSRPTLPLWKPHSIMSILEVYCLVEVLQNRMHFIFVGQIPTASNS